MIYYGSRGFELDFSCPAHDQQVDNAGRGQLVSGASRTRQSTAAETVQTATVIWVVRGGSGNCMRAWRLRFR